ncbi:hypothetical protein H5410_000350 [Solanum commersonii]|uniref:Uncharacterized protein n=1 Tax=Solanum commersonii TaxID=4109 RepID=A0A9J6AW97_SOLCO|nr:hypothetical protein H5410_000350 [Solanum commersonii]
MTKQIVLRAPSSLSIDRRRQPLLSNQDTSSRGGVRKARLAEVAGGTAAECAAVCCCCPCGLVNLLVMAVYKLPAGLCRKALRRKRRRRLMKKKILQSQCSSCDDSELSIHPIDGATTLAVVDGGNSLKSDEDVVALEKEMWSKFYGAGFWRSPSQKSDM